MHSRAKDLIQLLDLKEHPEGGFYREMFRSKKTVNGSNSALTSIYFLITANTVSHFHRIQSDEAWYFHEGDPLEIHSIHENGEHTIQQLGGISSHCSPFHIVEGNTIFGSKLANNSVDSYALVSCAVAPGFEFETFELFKREELLQHYPNHSGIIHALTRD